MSVRAMAAWLLCCVAWGCGGGGSTTPSDEGQLDAHSLYPLEPGSAWSYDVDAGEGSTTLAVTRVELREGSRAIVRTGQGNPIVYELRREGIFVVRDNVWLLRDPIVVGQGWEARGGRRAHVIATGQAFASSAGAFTGCVKVLETGGEVRVETTYCPKVGPVALESRGADGEMVRATLRGYLLGNDF